MRRLHRSYSVPERTLLPPAVAEVSTTIKRTTTTTAATRTKSSSSSPQCPLASNAKVNTYFHPMDASCCWCGALRAQRANYSHYPHHHHHHHQHVSMHHDNDTNSYRNKDTNNNISGSGGSGSGSTTNYINNNNNNSNNNSRRRSNSATDASQNMGRRNSNYNHNHNHSDYNKISGGGGGGGGARKNANERSRSHSSRRGGGNKRRNTPRTSDKGGQRKDAGGNSSSRPSADGFVLFDLGNNITIENATTSATASSQYGRSLPSVSGKQDLRKVAHSKGRVDKWRKYPQELEGEEGEEQQEREERKSVIAHTDEGSVTTTTTAPPLSAGSMEDLFSSVESQFALALQRERQNQMQQQQQQERNVQSIDRSSSAVEISSALEAATLRELWELTQQRIPRVLEEMDAGSADANTREEEKEIATRTTTTTAAAVARLAAVAEAAAASQHQVAHALHTLESACRHSPRGARHVDAFPPSLAARLTTEALPTLAAVRQRLVRERNALQRRVRRQQRQRQRQQQRLRSSTVSEDLRVHSQRGAAEGEKGEANEEAAVWEEIEEQFAEDAEQQLYHHHRTDGVVEQRMHGVGSSDGGSGNAGSGTNGRGHENDNVNSHNTTTTISTNSNKKSSNGAESALDDAASHDAEAQLAALEETLSYYHKSCAALRGALATRLVRLRDLFSEQEMVGVLAALHAAPVAALPDALLVAFCAEMEKRRTASEAAIVANSNNNSNNGILGGVGGNGSVSNSSSSSSASVTSRGGHDLRSVIYGMDTRAHNSMANPLFNLLNSSSSNNSEGVAAGDGAMSVAELFQSNESRAETTTATTAAAATRKAQAESLIARHPSSIAAEEATAAQLVTLSRIISQKEVPLFVSGSAFRLVHLRLLPLITSELERSVRLMEVVVEPMLAQLKEEMETVKRRAAAVQFTATTAAQQGKFNKEEEGKEGKEGKEEGNNAEMEKVFTTVESLRKAMAFLPDKYILFDFLRLFKNYDVSGAPVVALSKLVYYYILHFDSHVNAFFPDGGGNGSGGHHRSDNTINVLDSIFLGGGGAYRFDLQDCQGMLRLLGMPREHLFKDGSEREGSGGGGGGAHSINNNNNNNNNNNTSSSPSSAGRMLQRHSLALDHDDYLPGTAATTVSGASASNVVAHSRARARRQRHHSANEADFYFLTNLIIEHVSLLVADRSSSANDETTNVIGEAKGAGNPQLLPESSQLSSFSTASLSPAATQQRSAVESTSSPSSSLSPAISAVSPSASSAAPALASLTAHVPLPVSTLLQLLTSLLYLYPSAGGGDTHRNNADAMLAQTYGGFGGSADAVGGATAPTAAPAVFSTADLERAWATTSRLLVAAVLDHLLALQQQEKERQRQQEQQQQQQQRHGSEAQMCKEAEEGEEEEKTEEYDGTANEESGSSVGKTSGEKQQKKKKNKKKKHVPLASQDALPLKETLQFVKALLLFEKRHPTHPLLAAEAAASAALPPQSTFGGVEVVVTSTAAVSADGEALMMLLAASLKRMMHSREMFRPDHRGGRKNNHHHHLVSLDARRAAAVARNSNVNALYSALELLFMRSPEAFAFLSEDAYDTTSYHNNYDNNNSNSYGADAAFVIREATTETQEKTGRQTSSDSLFTLQRSEVMFLFSYFCNHYEELSNAAFIAGVHLFNTLTPIMAAAESKKAERLAAAAAAQDTAVNPRRLLQQQKQQQQQQQQLFSPRPARRVLMQTLSPREKQALLQRFTAVCGAISPRDVVTGLYSFYTAGDDGGAGGAAAVAAAAPQRHLSHAPSAPVPCFTLDEVSFHRMVTQFVYKEKYRKLDARACGLLLHLLHLQQQQQQQQQALARGAAATEPHASNASENHYVMVKYAVLKQIGHLLREGNSTDVDLDGGNSNSGGHAPSAGILPHLPFLVTTLQENNLFFAFVFSRLCRLLMAEVFVSSLDVVLPVFSLLAAESQAFGGAGRGRRNVSLFGEVHQLMRRRLLYPIEFEEEYGLGGAGGGSATTLGSDASAAADGGGGSGASRHRLQSSAAAIHALNSFAVLDASDTPLLAFLTRELLRLLLGVEREAMVALQLAAQGGHRGALEAPGRPQWQQQQEQPVLGSGTSGKEQGLAEGAEGINAAAHKGEVLIQSSSRGSVSAGAATAATEVTLDKHSEDGDAAETVNSELMVRLQQQQQQEEEEQVRSAATAVFNAGISRYLRSSLNPSAAAAVLRVLLLHSDSTSAAVAEALPLLLFAMLPSPSPSSSALGAPSESADASDAGMVRDLYPPELALLTRDLLDAFARIESAATVAAPAPAESTGWMNDAVVVHQLFELFQHCREMLLLILGDASARRGEGKDAERSNSVATNTESSKGAGVRGSHAASTQPALLKEGGSGVADTSAGGEAGEASGTKERDEEEASEEARVRQERHVEQLQEAMAASAAVRRSVTSVPATHIAQVLINLSNAGMHDATLAAACADFILFGSSAAAAVAGGGDERGPVGAANAIGTRGDGESGANASSSTTPGIGRSGYDDGGGAALPASPSALRRQRRVLRETLTPQELTHLLLATLMQFPPPPPPLAPSDLAARGSSSGEVVGAKAAGGATATPVGGTGTERREMTAEAKDAARTEIPATVTVTRAATAAEESKTNSAAAKEHQQQQQRAERQKAVNRRYMAPLLEAVWERSDELSEAQASALLRGLRHHYRTVDDDLARRLTAQIEAMASRRPRQNGSGAAAAVAAGEHARHSLSPSSAASSLPISSTSPSSATTAVPPTGVTEEKEGNGVALTPDDLFDM